MSPPELLILPKPSTLNFDTPALCASISLNVAASDFEDWMRKTVPIKVVSEEKKFAVIPALPDVVLVRFKVLENEAAPVRANALSTTKDPPMVAIPFTNRDPKIETAKKSELNFRNESHQEKKYNIPEPEVSSPPAVIIFPVPSTLNFDEPSLFPSISRKSAAAAFDALNKRTLPIKVESTTAKSAAEAELPDAENVIDRSSFNDTEPVTANVDKRDVEPITTAELSKVVAPATVNEEEIIPNRLQHRVP